MKKRKKTVKNTVDLKKQKKPKLWGLEKLTFNKAAQNYMDWDEKMAQDLKNDPEAAEWYSQFNNEYYGNTLDKDWRKNLHFKEQKKQIYDATNARNRDLYNTRYKYNEHENGIAIPDSYSEYCNPETAYVDYLDYKKKIPKFMREAKNSGLNKKEVLELTKIVFDLE
jgi:hypothetical protein